MKKLYSRWMYAWETELTTRDTNRIVRPLEWGFDWLEDWIGVAESADPRRTGQRRPGTAARAMLAVNESIIANSSEFLRLPDA